MTQLTIKNVGFTNGPIIQGQNSQNFYFMDVDHWLIVSHTTLLIVGW